MNRTSLEDQVHTVPRSGLFTIQTAPAWLGWKAPGSPQHTLTLPIYSFLNPSQATCPSFVVSCAPPLFQNGIIYHSKAGWWIHFLITEWCRNIKLQNLDRAERFLMEPLPCYGQYRGKQLLTVLIIIGTVKQKSQTREEICGRRRRDVSSSPVHSFWLCVCVHVYVL